MTNQQFLISDLPSPNQQISVLPLPVRWLWWMVFGVKTGKEVWGRRWIRIGFAKEHCFQFEVKELWRDGKGRGVSSFVGRVRYFEVTQVGINEHTAIKSLKIYSLFLKWHFVRISCDIGNFSIHLSGFVMDPCFGKSSAWVLLPVLWKIHVFVLLWNMACWPIAWSVNVCTLILFETGIHIFLCMLDIQITNFGKEFNFVYFLFIIVRAWVLQVISFDEG